MTNYFEARQRETEVSIVVPVYMCSAYLVDLYARLTVVLKDLVGDAYEIILVDDCGPDQSWLVIQELSEKDSRVKGLHLSRNFGQHAAITAGLEEAKGEWVVVMDCDLQDVPEEISRLYEHAKNGFEVVFAQRTMREDSWLKRKTSWFFYKSLGYLTDTRIDHTIANFGVYNKIVIQAVLSMREVHKYFPIMVRWVGFRADAIPVRHAKRQGETSSYSFSKLLSLASGTIMSFSNKPLKLIVKFGFLVSLFSLLHALYLFMDALLNKIIVPGWASVMVSLWFISGMFMMITGVVGLYIGKTFDETKKRPVYIISERTDR